MSTHSPNMRPPVFTLGSTVTLLGATRALGRKNIPQYCLTPAKDFVRWSRWYRELSNSSGTPSVENLPNFLENISKNEIANSVLLPCSDNWAKAVAELSPSITQRFKTSVPAAEILKIFTDKELFRALLASVGVPHPQTIPLNSLSDIENIPESFFTSAFLKPRKSQEFFKQYQVKGVFVSNRETALSEYQRIVKDGHLLVLQEYVAGPPTNHYFIDGFVDRHGKIRALLARQRLRMYPPDFGNSSIMESVSLESVQPAVDSLYRLFAGTPYRGIFSAEFKRDDKDGLFKLLEINPRAWWYVEFAARCGVDVCEMCYHDALEEDVQDCFTYKLGQRCVYWYYDWFACQSAVQQKQMTWFQALRDWLVSQHSMCTFDDPAPAFWGISQFVKSNLSKFRRT